MDERNLTHREKNAITRLVGTYERNESAGEIAQRVAETVRTFRDPDVYGDLGQNEQMPLSFGAAYVADDYCVHIRRHCAAVYYWPNGRSHARKRLCWLYLDPLVDFVCFLWDD